MCFWVTITQNDGAAGHIRSNFDAFFLLFINTQAWAQIILTSTFFNFLSSVILCTPIGCLACCLVSNYVHVRVCRVTSVLNVLVKPILEMSSWGLLELLLGPRNVNCDTHIHSECESLNESDIMSIYSLQTQQHDEGLYVLKDTFIQNSLH